MTLSIPYHTSLKLETIYLWRTHGSQLNNLTSGLFGPEIFPHIEEANMWTRGEVAQFKETAGAGGGRLTVGHGETVTVRVPTHQRAKCLCWEFATDNYDIGEYLLVHVS